MDSAKWLLHPLWIYITVNGFLAIKTFAQSTLPPQASATNLIGTELPLETVSTSEPTYKTTPSSSQDGTPLQTELSTSFADKRTTQVSSSTEPSSELQLTTISSPTDDNGVASTSLFPVGNDTTPTESIINEEVEFILVIIITVVAAVVIFLIVALIVYCICTRRKRNMMGPFVSFKKGSRGHRYEKVERQMAKGTLPRAADQPSGGWIFQASPEKGLDLPLTTLDGTADIESGATNLEINGNLDKDSAVEYPGSTSDYPGSDSALGLAAQLELEDEEEDLNPMYKTLHGPDEDEEYGATAVTHDLGIDLDHHDRSNTDMHSFADETDRPVEL